MVKICTSCGEKIVPKQLDKPFVTENYDRIEFDYNQNATCYEVVTKDRKVRISVNVFFTNGYSGEIKVKAVGDGRLYTDSEYTIIYKD